MGVDYPIKGNLEPEYVRTIADDLNNRMLDLSNQLVNKSPEKTAVLTALNLEHELHGTESEKEEIFRKVEQKVKEVLKKIDRVLQG